MVVIGAGEFQLIPVSPVNCGKLNSCYKNVAETSST